MNEEFITLDSRLVIAKEVLREKKVKGDTEESFTRGIAFAALMTYLVYSVYEITEKKEYFAIIQIIMVFFWLAPHVKRMYRTLFVKTWKSSIKLTEIKEVKAKPLQNGLETEVTLQLANGRKKYFVFRNRETDIKEFMQALSLPQNNLLT